MNKTSTRPPTKQQRRRQAQQQRQVAQVQAAKNKRFAIGASLGFLAVVALAVGIYFALQGSQNQPQGSTNPAYAPINGISCDANEQLSYHIHAHLTMYINGQKAQLPQSIGIASDGSCIYWLHTHDTSGVIHIESPTRKVYTLGTFLQEWSQRFPQLTYPTQLDQTSGWQVYVNGKPYSGDFHNIPLDSHTLITLAYNSPGITPDTIYNWGGL